MRAVRDAGLTRTSPTDSSSLRRIRSTCEAIVEALELSVPFSTDAFAAALSMRTGRKIVLHAESSLPGPCGVWIALSSADHVFYDATTTPLHRQHIVLHELGHVVASHRGSGPGGEWVRRLLPDLDPSMVKRTLARSAYADVQEVEAEMFASVAADYITHLARDMSHLTGLDSDSVVARLVNGLSSSTRGS